MVWSKLVSSENDNEHFASQCRMVLASSPAPWKTLVSANLDPQSSQAVMDVLQTELDSDEGSGYRMKCLRCMRVLGELHEVVPSSFFCPSTEIHQDGTLPLYFGAFADIYKGSMKDSVVSLKVLRMLASGYKGSELKDFRREALLWRQLRHPSILPFVGISYDLFAPRLCLISPWMENGSLVEFLRSNPEHDRLKAILEIANGIQYLHNLDPPVVHGDIKGANILVKNDLSCCLADFGLALIAESHLPGSSTMHLRGSLRWSPPEMMKPSLFDKIYFTAVDIYSYGCTIIEIFTGEPPFSYIKDAALINEVLIEKKKPRQPSPGVFPSGQLWSLVTSCLSFTAKERPTIHSVISSMKDLDAACHKQAPHPQISESNPSTLVPRYSSGTFTSKDFQSPSLSSAATSVVALNSPQFKGNPQSSTDRFPTCTSINAYYSRFLSVPNLTWFPHGGKDIIRLSFRRVEEFHDYAHPVGKELLGTNDTVLVEPGCLYGLTVTTSVPLFIYVFYLDPRTSEIYLLHSPQLSNGEANNSGDAVEKVTIGYGVGAKTLAFAPDCEPVDVDLFKIFLSKRPMKGLLSLTQSPPFKEVRGRMDVTWDDLKVADGSITKTITVVIPSAK